MYGDFYELLVSGDSGTSVRVENPLTGWSASLVIDSDGYGSLLLPRAYTTYIVKAVPEAYHVTADASVSVTAANIFVNTTDFSSILTTKALGTRYVVQDYPSEGTVADMGTQVAMLAIEDSTILSFVLPCDLKGGLMHAGDTVHQMLMRGEVYRLLTYGLRTFSGMEVTSNGKPFALFEGHTCGNVPSTGTSAMDHLYEQALPVTMWGSEFVLVPTCGRSGGRGRSDIIQVTTVDSCVIMLGGLAFDTLVPFETTEFALPYGNAQLLTATAPISVVQYITSHEYGGDPGDPSSVMVIPIDKGVCRARFVITNSQWTVFPSCYVNIAVPTFAVGGMRLDGVSVASAFSPVDSQYSYACIELQAGRHTLENGSACFVAHAYALEYDETYAYVLGTEMLLPRDTVELYDTVCQGMGYTSPFPDLPVGCTADTGTFHYVLFAIEDDTIRCYSLWLTVRGVPYAEFAIDTDCVHYCYHILVTVQGDTADCRMVWQSYPYDSTLAGQPWNDISISTEQHTTYDFDIVGFCPFDTSFAIHPILWPVAQIEVQPERLRVDDLAFDAYDMSINADSRQWLVNDTYVGNSSTIHYTAHELDDSLLLTLVAANEACVDTMTIVIPIDNPEVWAPNVFFPDRADNNVFAPVLNECKAEGLYIYNRQGLLLARIEGDSPSWDGSRNGTPCPQGTYAYLLYFRSDTEPQRLQKKVGTVTLIR